MRDEVFKLMKNLRQSIYVIMTLCIVYSLIICLFGSKKEVIYINLFLLNKYLINKIKL